MRKLLCLIILVLTPYWAMANITQAERALVIISDINLAQTPELISINQKMETLTQDGSLKILTPHYSEIHLLKMETATFGQFKQTLRNLAAREEILAIDVILALNSEFKKIIFKDRSLHMDEMKKDFLSAGSYTERDNVSNTKLKLRIMYNLSHFGGSHCSTFYQMGFDICAGAKGINANAEVEFISILKGLVHNRSFKRSFFQSNNPVDLLTIDAPLRRRGKETGSELINVNSKKLFFGFIHTTISTPPREVQ